METPEKLEATIVNDELIGSSKDKAFVNKPTEEEIEQFKLNFENAVKDFESTKYQIGDESTASKYIDFLIDYVTYDACWAKSAWMGIIKLEQELQEIKKSDESVLNVSFQALQFILYILSNPSGTGLESAKRIEAVANILTELFEIVDKLSKDATVVLKEIQHKQDIVSAALQGFYLELLESNIEVEDPDTDKGCDCGDGDECNCEEKCVDCNNCNCKN